MQTVRPAVPRPPAGDRTPTTTCPTAHPAHAQTLTQPSVVAYVTQRFGSRSGDQVLEVGAGSGYQAVVLARLVKSFTRSRS
ncbi:MAG: hypothetical protein IPM24_11350 [Bryobacterales bacterium]|nr:hypothetical protein [Bryobacterales bacterium]